MSHFMIRLSALPSSSNWIRTDPRACLNAVRDAAASMDGHLDGCWFTENGNSLVAILHAVQDVSGERIEEIRHAFSQTERDFTIEVEALATISELSGRDVHASNRIEVDPVDLGSYLSFPASDPPSWFLG